MDLELRIVDWIKKYLVKSGLNTLVIGISGGIDSALTSTLCAMTGAKTILISLPIHQNKAHLERANNHIKNLKSKFSNVESYEYDLTDVFYSFKNKFDKIDTLAEANTRSRLRMVCLYHVASLNNGLVVGTGNKVEDFGIGFYTKYGDGGVDISPIADLMKSEVKELAIKIKVIDEIIKAKPSDGLWDDSRTDEDQIGANYEELEWIMNLKEPITLNKLSNRQKEVLKIYKYFNSRNKHKMIPIPVFKK